MNEPIDRVVIVVAVIGEMALGKRLGKVETSWNSYLYYKKKYSSSSAAGKTSVVYSTYTFVLSERVAYVVL